MDVIGDLVVRDRRTESLAVQTDSRAGSDSYEKLCTNSWKAGNLLRHYGVRGDATVAIAAGEVTSPQPLLAFFGSALLGATAQFDPPELVGADALLVPADRVGEFDLSPGTQVLAYGEVPDETGVAHFERELWSENPTMPPDAVSPDASALAVGSPDSDEERYSHEKLLTAADEVVTGADLDGEDSVALRSRLSHPGAVAAGVLAPIAAGATILVDEAQTGDVGVGSGDLPESRQIDPTTVC